jgi:periplasmic divalent cation tolerance protein
LAEALVVFSTVSGLPQARKLAAVLLKERLAACVNITGPVESHYRWKGKLHADREYLLVIKTGKKTYPALEQCLRSRHPYEVPEIIAMPVTSGSRAYLDWVTAETGSAGKKKKR